MEVKRAQMPADGKSVLVEKSGWLFKEGSQVKSWKKRFFKLQDQALTYYEALKESSIKGVFLIRDSECRVSKKKDRPFLFEIVHPRRTLYCAAESERDMNEWVTAISNNIAFQINVEKGFTTQIATLKSELEHKAKETAEANRTMEDMRVRMQLAAIATPSETKAAQDAVFEKQLAELRAANEALQNDVKSAQANLVAQSAASAAALTAATAAAAALSSSNGHSNGVANGSSNGADNAALVQSLEEELAATRAQLAKVKKERQILKAEVKRLVGVGDGSAAAAPAE